MKILTLGFAIIGSSTSAFATQNAVNQQAFIPTQTTSVANALNLADNAKVKIKAKVVQSLGDEKYELQDSSGKIIVEIDDELWQNKAVQTEQSIEVVGEIDVDYKPLKRVQIDANQIRF